MLRVPFAGRGLGSSTRFLVVVTSLWFPSFHVCVCVCVCRLCVCFGEDYACVRIGVYIYIDKIGVSCDVSMIFHVRFRCSSKRWLFLTVRESL